MSESFQIHLDTSLESITLNSNNYYELQVDEKIIARIKSIELYSIEIPMTYYNINTNNNVLKYVENKDEVKTISVPVGYYSIQQLIDAITILLGSDYNITVSSTTNRLTFNKPSGVSSFSLQYANSTISNIIGLTGDSAYDRSCVMNNSYNLIFTNYFLVDCTELAVPSNNKSILYGSGDGNYIAKIPNNIANVGFGNIYSYQFKLSKKILYTNTIQLSKLTFRLVDMNGILLDLNNADYSLTINIYR
jgi:hypothetical protein